MSSGTPCGMSSMTESEYDELNSSNATGGPRWMRSSRAGIVPYAYAYARTHQATPRCPVGPVCAGRGSRGARRWPPRGAPRHMARRRSLISRTRAAGSKLYFRRGRLGDGVRARLAYLRPRRRHRRGGPLFRTRTGEPRCAGIVEVLAKALRPLPLGKEEEVDGRVVRHSEFADPELRYRQRYADLAVHPEVRRCSSRARAW